MSLQHVAERSSQFDIIHIHTDWTHLPLLTTLRVPFLTTMHGRLDLPGLSELVRQFPDAPFVSISENQRGPLLGANWAGTVYHDAARSLKLRWPAPSHHTPLCQMSNTNGHDR